ncbi:MAG: sugar porter family MFS transporter [Flavobacteriaceae bacterium]|nr:sugar porter family MFS transporter [Flavobacteriaceae bacterium]
MKQKIWFWSLVSALAGFLFGFDTVVISGADQTLEKIWDSSSQFHGFWVMGSALFGTVIGALTGSIPTNRIGRRQTLILIGVLYVVSAIGSASVNNPYLFGFFRFIGGLGVGASTVAAPVYISEIAPAKKRGRLVGLYQLNIVLGILVAFLSNYLISQLISPEAWRIMIGMEALPALIYCFLVIQIPKSPRWLITKNRISEAQQVLSMVNPMQNINELKAQIDSEIDQSKTHRVSIYLKRYRFPLILTFFVALFNQFSGINAFLYYAPRIFEAGGLGEDAALLSSVGVGVVNLLFTLLGISIIDRFGRRKLLLLGSIGYVISLTLVSLTFFIHWEGSLLPPFFFLFIAAHAIGSGTVIWVYISEIFPNLLRHSGQSFGSSVHWILAWMIPSLIPLLFSSIGPGFVFAVFSGMMFLQLLFVILMMPETKGVPLEVLSKKLEQSSS